MWIVWEAPHTPHVLKGPRAVVSRPQPCCKMTAEDACDSPQAVAGQPCESLACMLLATCRLMAPPPAMLYFWKLPYSCLQLKCTRESYTGTHDHLLVEGSRTLGHRWLWCTSLV